MARGTQKVGSEGLRSEALQLAFKQALAGKVQPLEELLSRHGGLPSPRPNLKLAAAFGAECAAEYAKQDLEREKAVVALLTLLAQDESPVDSPHAFLACAAAHGFCAVLTKARSRTGLEGKERTRNSRDIDAAWSAIALLTADPRLPVRIGAVDALTMLAAHPEGADALIERAGAWLEEEDRELRFGVAAAVIAVLGNTQAIASVRNHDAMLDYVSRAIAIVADAPRSADRSEGRRRVLLVLPQALCTFVSRVPGDSGVRFLTAECERAELPQIRDALSDVIVRLQKDSQGLGRAAIEGLRKALEASAAPLRDGVFIRPGTGRGKAGRKIR